MAEPSPSPATVLEMRDRIAAQHGVTQADRDTLMTGTDQSTLFAQADRLRALAAQRLVQGNVAPREGAVIVTRSADYQALEATREFMSELFNEGEVA